MTGARLPLPIAAMLALVLVLSSTALAHIGGAPGSGGAWEPNPPSKEVVLPRGERPCPDAHPEWRPAQTVEGVDLQEDLHCEPDNPRLIAAFVKGTNNVPQSLLNDVALHEDAARKSNDRDGDGDPDVIEITLEVAELNGWHLPDDDLAETFDIAPGVHPSFWVFHPKSTIAHTGEAFFDIARMPPAPIRVEQGDTVRITLENTHYFPHTIHLHGVDHPFVDGSGEGNDGVPVMSETPVLPGEARTYEFTARQPGTMFYHCHVQPHVHVTMGLGTIIIIEEDREDQWLQTFNPGGGLVRYPSKAVTEAPPQPDEPDDGSDGGDGLPTLPGGEEGEEPGDDSKPRRFVTFDREYDLVYQDADKELSAIVSEHNDPRVIAKKQNREYDATDRDMDYYLLNGRSFPYTLRESTVVVRPGEDVKLRVINAGEDTLSLHTHGHKTRITHLDGVKLKTPVYRDVVTLTAAQRADLWLNTTLDGLNSYGEGLWFLHDHREKAVTTDGIGPGGDISVIAYESWLDPETAFPKPPTNTDWRLLFTEAYYRGEIPVWHELGQPGIFGEIIETDAGDQGDESTFPVPAPGGPLVSLALVAVALLLARRREVRS